MSSGVSNGAAPYLGPVAPAPSGLVQVIEVEQLLPVAMRDMLFAETGRWRDHVDGIRKPARSRRSGSMPRRSALGAIERAVQRAAGGLRHARTCRPICQLSARIRRGAAGADRRRRRAGDLVLPRPRGIRGHGTHGAGRWLPRHPDGVLRLLSLPCATGEEPYSMAMALLDAGFPASRFRIDAVDVSGRALAQRTACSLWHELLPRRRSGLP